MLACRSRAMASASARNRASRAGSAAEPPGLVLAARAGREVGRDRPGAVLAQVAEQVGAEVVLADTTGDRHGTALPPARPARSGNGACPPAAIALPIYRSASRVTTALRA